MNRSTSESAAACSVSAQVVQLCGAVQGFGVRPAVARLATQMRLVGYVQNTSECVLIHVEGRSEDIDKFIGQLLKALPEAARVRDVCHAATTAEGFAEFSIRTQPDPGDVAVEVPVDRRVCPECVAEILDQFHNPQSNRRFAYAFTSCTHCGPRFSIVDSLPFERHLTAMADFELCSECRCEFVDPQDRRCHAQTMACPNCGPHLALKDAAGNLLTADDKQAIELAAEALRCGQIIAIRGLGGYQLLCDAANETTVQQLRQFKQRPGKPLAVMLSAEYALQIKMCPREHVLLHSPENPIVIVDRFHLCCLAESVSSGLHSVGLFLPTTPLHWLLLECFGDPVVATSGNLAEEPLAIDSETARRSLGSVAERFLDHNRSIRQPVDDSVVRVIAGQDVTIRAGRGLAPMPLPVKTSHRILAVGGEQKVACALSNGRQAVLGPHIGDLHSLSCREHFQDRVQALLQLYRMTPDVIVHDLHPDYFTTRWAATQGIRTVAVQHHHAHVVAGMLEHGLLDQQVLGVAFDGTGYGTDGTIWGGEFLLATSKEFQRVGSVRPFVLPGGEAAIKEPWRIAVALLTDAMPELTADNIAELLAMGTHARAAEKWHSKDQRRITADDVRRIQQVMAGTFSPPCTSAGRLFDGVGALVLGLSAAGFEGEVAMRLESACLPEDVGDEVRLQPLRFELQESETPQQTVPPGSTTHSAPHWQLDWRPLIRQLVEELRGGCPAQLLAVQFHRAFSVAIRMIADQFPGVPVILSGGCFQNRLLTEWTLCELRHRPTQVCNNQRIPPNDGGLAAGQLAIAAAWLKET
jgi:hydrogenase maturation protein HypF